MRILALCGSLRPESTTLKALRVVLEGVISAGGECDLLTGDDMDLPLYREIDTPPLLPRIQRLRDLASQADGFLWGSPEYHGTCSGVLKNALDWLSSDELSGKPVALIAVAGGGMGGQGTLDTLRMAARNVHAWVLPQQVSIGSSDQAFDDSGRLRDRKAEKRLHDLGCRLVACAKVLPQLR